MEPSPDDFKGSLGALRDYEGERNWCVRLSDGRLFGPFDTCEPVIDILTQQPGGWGFFFDLVWTEGNMFWTSAFCKIFPEDVMPMQARPLYDPIVPIIRDGEIINRQDVINS